MTITNDPSSLNEAQDAPVSALFPPDFLWGAATSAYQIEGAVNEDGRAPSTWDRFSATPGKTYQGQTGEVAADHYHRMEEDVALMAQLNLSSYRFSLAWPRILPEGIGTVNQRGLDFYDRLVDTLLARGIQPLATLHHWDLPIALYEKGGWTNRDTAYAFAEYADVVTSRLGDRVNWWLTHNEPWCSSYLSYYLGLHAPGLHDKQLAVNVGHHILLSHGLAIPLMRSHLSAQAQIGIAIDFYPAYAADERPATLSAVQRADTFRNRWFLDPVFRGSYPEGLFTGMGVEEPPIQEGDLAIISTPIDFLGVNYYSRNLIRGNTETETTNDEGYETISPIPGSSYTEMGWEIFPEGLTNILTRIHREYTPKAMVVTESGAAFPDQLDASSTVHDQQRIEYLRAHIEHVAEAIRQGAPMKGYTVWSLMDNYEWAEGYRKRFGLVYVDYPTQRRIIKDSGHWYANFIEQQRKVTQ
jgi:beta-glucosidase